MPDGAAATSTTVTFQIGPAKRPPIKHDFGFLTLPLSGAVPAILNLPILTAKRAAWTAAELWNAYQQHLKHALPDGIAAYEHYLSGYGRPREFSYERYVKEDRAGMITLSSVLDATIAGAESAFRAPYEKDTRPHITFSITSDSIPCGGSSAGYPYPQTPNWRFALGAHFIWLSADIDVKRTPTLPTFTMTLVLHAEDRYNFNPGQAAIDTVLGIRVPDAVHGYLFERTKYATPYIQSATLTRRLHWTYGIKASVGIQ